MVVILTRIRRRRRRSMLGHDKSLHIVIHDTIIEIAEIAVKWHFGIANTCSLVRHQPISSGSSSSSWVTPIWISVQSCCALAIVIFMETGGQFARHISCTLRCCMFSTGSWPFISHSQERYNSDHLLEELEYSLSEMVSQVWQSLNRLQVSLRWHEYQIICPTSRLLYAFAPSRHSYEDMYARGWWKRMCPHREQSWWSSWCQLLFVRYSLIL